MLHITAGPEKLINPTTDALGRDRIGYAPTMSPAALYDATHGTWVLGERAHRQSHYLVSYGGTVQQAVEIQRIDTVPGGKQVITGRILTAGDPVYDEYVGQPSPVEPARNPVRYFDSPHDAAGVLCACGCGERAGARSEFLAGHDQRAIHDRVAKIGSTKEFMAWFDTITAPFAPR